VRRVSRVIRKVDAWSVAKVALIFWTIVFAILLISGIMLWTVANSTGTIGNVEGFIKSLFSLDSFSFDGGKLFRASVIIAFFGVITATAATVTVVVIFNLITELVGGVRVTVLEEEVIIREPVSEPTRRTSSLTRP
jgi:hypothetical protein